MYCICCMCGGAGVSAMFVFECWGERERGRERERERERDREREREREKGKEMGKEI